MAYAISQELSDTFSRIDGVLTARVHVCSEVRIRPPIRVPCLPPPFSSCHTPGFACRQPGRQNP